MPSKKAMKKVKDAIRVITCRKSTYEGLEQKVEKLNPLIRGWRNYFQHGNSTKRFKQLDEYVWMKLWRRVYYRRKQKKYRGHVLYGFRKWYATSGIEYFYYLNKKRYVSVFWMLWEEDYRKAVWGRTSCTVWGGRRWKRKLPRHRLTLPEFARQWEGYSRRQGCPSWGGVWRKPDVGTD